MRYNCNPQATDRYIECLNEMDVRRMADKAVKSPRQKVESQ